MGRPARAKASLATITAGTGTNLRLDYLPETPGREFRQRKDVLHLTPAPAAHAAAGRASDPAEHFHQPVVDVKPITATHQLPPLLLDSNLRPLLIPNHERVHFPHGLIDESHRTLDQLLVDFDDQAPQ